MTAYTDQHEIEKLKTWWKTYGTALIVGILLGTALLFGTRYWRQHQEQQRVVASELYAQLQQAAQQKQLDVVRRIGARLTGDYSSTPYAGLAALTLAQSDYSGGNAEDAKRHLQWAVDNAHDPATMHAARLRLARVLASEGKNDQALALINVKDTDGFEAEYEELRGDILIALKRPGEARAAYGDALKHAGPGGYQAVLSMKLDDLGTEKAQ